MPLWQQVAEQVFHTERIIGRDLRHYAQGRFLEVRYEELCEQPRRTVAKLQDWLGAWGDYSYSDMRVPDSFKLSQGVSLPDDVTVKMQDHLNKLQTQVVA